MGIPLGVARGHRALGDRWGRRDWLLAQAYTAYIDILCPGCGQPRHESMDPQNERAPGHTHRYVAQVMRCHSCTERDMLAEQFKDADQPQALSFSTTLVDVEQARRVAAEQAMREAFGD